MANDVVEAVFPNMDDDDIRHYAILYPQNEHSLKANKKVSDKVPVLMHRVTAFTCQEYRLILSMVHKYIYYIDVGFHLSITCCRFVKALLLKDKLMKLQVGVNKPYLCWLQIINTVRQVTWSVAIIIACI